MPEMQELRVLSLGQEDPLEEDMANGNPSSILASEIPWTEEQSMWLERVSMTDHTHTHIPHEWKLGESLYHKENEGVVMRRRDNQQ